MAEPRLTQTQRFDLFIGGVIRRVILLMVAVPATGIAVMWLASIWSGLPAILAAILLAVLLAPFFRGIRKGLAG